MAPSKILLTTLLCGSALFATYPTEVGGQMLYLLHRQQAGQAFRNYISYAEETDEQDFALLQQAGMRLLEQGITSESPETQLLCMFGAGVANSPELLPILEKGIRSKEPRIQMIALGYLARQGDDRADELVVEALSSPFLLTRLEGCYLLAQKNHPEVLMHLQSLMVKVPPLVRALFPQIVVHLDNAGANAYLRQLLQDPELDVRIEAILSIAKAGRDDFLPQLRKLVLGAHHAIQESCALALGELQDSSALARLRDLQKSTRLEVRLAAAVALLELGEKEALTTIDEAARQGNLFAISILGKLKKSAALLHKLAKSGKRDVRLNAKIALIQQGINTDLDEILFPDASDLGYVRISSPGRALKAWKTVPCAHQNTKAYPGIVGQTVGLRERLLRAMIELPEEAFYQVARKVLDEKQTELIPLLVTLLENKRTDEATALLKQGHQTAGEPLIRHYCTLALFRMHEEGPYEQQLITWAQEKNDQMLIEFQPEKKRTSLTTRHELTPQQSSRCLIETFEALASAQNQAGVEALVNAMAYGNPQNRYALAGLLIRTTE